MSANDKRKRSKKLNYPRIRADFLRAELCTLKTEQSAILAGLDGEKSASEFASCEQNRNEICSDRRARINGLRRHPFRPIAAQGAAYVHSGAFAWLIVAFGADR